MCKTQPLFGRLLPKGHEALGDVTCQKNPHGLRRNTIGYRRIVANVEWWDYVVLEKSVITYLIKYSNIQVVVVYSTPDLMYDPLQLLVAFQTVIVCLVDLKSLSQY